jgi:hypothetical protein
MARQAQGKIVITPRGTSCAAATSKSKPRRFKQLLTACQKHAFSVNTNRYLV